MNRLWNIRHAQLHQAPPKWVPILGELQKTLQKGEYLPLRPLPMFESNFVQVTNRGGPVFVHHRANRLTMGVAASLPGLILPDILLIAQPPESRGSSSLLLTRMIPLDLVHLYVHDLSSWRLKLRLVTGRCYYLELDAPDHEVGFLFDRWIRLINLLREPVTTWAPRTMHTPPLDVSLATAPASTWHLEDQGLVRRTVTVAEPTFPYKRLSIQKGKKAKALKRRFKSQAVGDSMPLVWSQLEHAGDKRRAAEKKSRPDTFPDKTKAQIQVSGKTSITIRTIFSIISNTINQSQSSKPGTSDSEDTTGRGGLIKSPSRCLSNETPEFTFLGSHDHLEALLWKQDMEDLMDPESSTLSSSSFGPATYHPAMFFFPPRSFFPMPRDKSRKMGSRRGHGPPLSQKVTSTPTTFFKVPFIVDQTQKVAGVSAHYRKAPAFHVPSQKSTAIGGPSRKVPPISVIPQKTPTVRGPSRKVPAMRAPLQRTPLPSQKAISPSAPKKELLFPPALPKKAPSSVRKHQMAVAPSPMPGKAADKPQVSSVGTLGGAMLERTKSKEKPKPKVLVGTQEMNKIEKRTQMRSLEMPFTTTKKESEEVLFSKTRELTLEGLRGRGKLEDRAHRVKEEMSLDLPGMKSKEVEQQKIWVKTEEMAVEGAKQERIRPFSVEGLALAKLMIMANSKDQHMRMPVVSLPSWLSMTSQMSATSTKAPLPFSPSQLTLMEGHQVIIREQPESHTWVKKNVQQWTEREPLWDPVGPSNMPSPSVPVSDSPKMVNDPQVPIALPASDWEDLPQSPVLETPIHRTRGSIRMQQETTNSEETERVPNGSPALATAGSSEILQPELLETDDMTEMASKAEGTEEEQDTVYPSPSEPPNSQDLE